jgi:pimeloyl-ACP methyl ester carboxylesterase
MRQIATGGNEVPPRRSGFTPARVVALAVIAVLIAGLVSVGSSSADASVSVPAGAEAGDLTLAPCTYPTEDGDHPADCGTLVVPEDRTDPGSRLIALPVTVIHARSADPLEPIFRLEGGPGVSNMTFPLVSRLAADHDVVLVGYRGLDGSERLDCPEVTSALQGSTDLLSEASFRAYGDAFRACADRLAEEGVDVSQYGLVQQVDDLEAARAALGYERVDLISESAGTRTAMIYAWRYPESIHRSVMIGVNPPGNYLWDPAVTAEQIARYAGYCSADPDCSARTDDLPATIRRTAADVPERWYLLPVEGSTARIISFMGLMEATPAASPASGPMVLDTWLSASEGDASGLWLTSLLGDVLFPEMFVWGQYAAAGSIDSAAAREYFVAPPPEGSANLGYAASSFTWGGGRLADAWPAPAEVGEYQQVRPSDVETLLISGELDLTTPPQVAAEELLPSLPNGHQVVLEGLGHTVDFWNNQTEAGTHLITTFFDTGVVDDSLYVPQRVDLTPGMTHPAIAKISAGSLVGLTLITVLSLLWMAAHVRRRGGFGPETGAVLRSLFPVLLGLGGWSAGVLIVLTTMPWVPLNGALLAVLGAGVAIGLGVYAAWVRRGWSGGTKAAGSAAAMAGALVGARLGFLAGSGPLAILSAILGAALGSNLFLILLDIVAGGQGRSVVPTAVADRVAERVGA